MGRVLQRLQPGAVAQSVGVGNAVGIEKNVQRARNETQDPYAGHLQTWALMRSGCFHRAIQGKIT